MTPTPLSSAELPLDARLTLRVTGDHRVKLSATIWPTRLTAHSVSGVVDWHGTDLLSSLVSAEGEESDWGQRFLLVWAAAGPHSVSAVPLLRAEQWRVVHLTLPDLDGQHGDTVRVCLNRRRWTATVSAARPLDFPAELLIPVELHQLDVGSLVTEMASRLLLQRPWLTSEEVPG